MCLWGQYGAGVQQEFYPGVSQGSHISRMTRCVVESCIKEELAEREGEGAIAKGDGPYTMYSVSIVSSRWKEAPGVDLGFSSSDRVPGQMLCTR